ncbi:MAG TPA: helix-turn-helix domain-containing protein [Candidatus Eisenbacteria bacterium]|nr:helix-turn-helix domain-containing protein [Candidatus Eisenbacteria bacterium]
MEIPHILQSLGFSDKEIRIYLTLLSGGPSSVRKLAKDTEINRGTVYEVLKSLQENGLAGMYQKHKKQFFLAEDPEKLVEVTERKERTVASLKRELAEALPELRSLYAHGGAKPTVKYYEGHKGCTIILNDVLKTMSLEQDKTYRAYSSVALRDYLYREFPTFTKERISRRLFVRVIAIGAGGDDQPLSERRWLSQKNGSPTYSIIYGPKVAFLSVGANEAPLGILIEDANVAETERIIFDRLWETLK